MNRPSWSTIWMNLAFSLAKRSTCSRLQVGCVIVSKYNTQVLSVGYNGNYTGGPNGCDSNEPGKCGCLHAEDNALLKLDYHDSYDDKVMYVTHLPCMMCAKRIINAGVNRVFYAIDYRDTSSKKILPQVIKVNLEEEIKVPCNGTDDSSQG